MSFLDKLMIRGREIHVTTSLDETGHRVEKSFGMSVAKFLQISARRAFFNLSDDELNAVLEQDEDIQLFALTTYNADGQPDGPEDIYAENGVLETRRIYENGQRKSWSVYDYQDGLLEEEILYRDNKPWLRTPYNKQGEIHGERWWYNKDGLWLRGIYKNNVMRKKVECLPDGTPHGDMTEYRQDKTLARITPYENGVRQGVRRWYNKGCLWLRDIYEKGHVRRTEECTPDGVPHGRFSQLGYDNRLSVVGHNDNGILHGRWRLFDEHGECDEDGVPPAIAEGDYVHGNAEGIWAFPLRDKEDERFVLYKKGVPVAYADKPEDLENWTPSIEPEAEEGPSPAM